MQHHHHHRHRATACRGVAALFVACLLAACGGGDAQDEPAPGPERLRLASWNDVDQQLEQDEADTLTVAVGGSDEPAIATAVEGVRYVMALRGLPGDTFVFVHGADAEAAARAADRLAAGGLTHVRQVAG